MKPKNRYDTTGLVEGQSQPGSRGRVLKNIVGITRKREMDQLEASNQLRALEELVGMYDRDYRFTASDVCRIHKMWLGRIYEWAGQYRQVNLSKGDFPFAASKQIPKLMAELERGPLKEFTPCRFASLEEVAVALAIVHTELLLIHPFRDGNGRLARLFAVLMALQAGLPPLDFGTIRGSKRKEYFSAVQIGLDRNYMPMTKIFIEVIRRTLRRQTTH